MKKLKSCTILLDDIIYWLQKNGGASRYWYEISSRLAQSGVITQQIRRSEVTQNPWSRILLKNPVIINSAISIKFSRYLDCAIPKSLRAVRKSLVFHSSHYRLPLDKSIANVVTVHDFTYEMFKSGLARFVHVWQKKRAIRHADVIICISEFTKNHLIKLYPEFSNKTIEVIYHGVGKEFFNFDTRPEIPSNEIVYLGARDHYKRFDLAIEAVQLTADKILTIVGSSLSTEEKEILDAKIPNQWQYAGRLSDQELNALYNRAFCFIYPSDSEGFGLPLLEAMRAGCPVVCSNMTVFPEIAGDAALYARDQSGTAYAEQIALLNNPELRMEMLSRGFKRVSSFTWEKCFERTLDIYQLALQIRSKGILK